MMNQQEALVLFRLRLVRETEHLPVRVKATRGVIAISGKVRTEALRQRVENIARSTLGLRELRSSISIALLRPFRATVRRCGGEMHR